MIRLVASTFFMVFGLLIVSQILLGVAKEERATLPAGKQAPATALAAAPRSEIPKGSSSQTVIERDASGQFHLALLVNGQEASFLVDTGADTVALTVDDAERLGLGIEQADFQPITRTASGTGNGAVVTIDRLQVGGDEFHDVHAVVAEGLHENLLGQSVLRQLGNVELRGDTMIIRHD